MRTGHNDHHDDASSVQSSSGNEDAMMRTPVDFGQLANATKMYPQRSSSAHPGAHPPQAAGCSSSGSSEARMSASSSAVSLVSHRHGGVSTPHRSTRDKEDVDMPSGGFRTIDDEKRDLLTKLRRLREQKVHISRDYGMHSNVREMRQEYEMIRSNMQMESSVRFQRKVLIAITSGMEFLNNKYDPFNVDLNGWSETIMDSITDYDQIFERLHQKYKGTATMPPEFELIMAVAGSALTFHLSNTFFKKSMGNAMKNPTAVQNILSEIKKASGGAAASVPPPPPPHMAAAGFVGGDGGGGGGGGGPTFGAPPPMYDPRMMPCPPPPPPPTGYPAPPQNTGVQSLTPVVMSRSSQPPPQDTDSELSWSVGPSDDDDNTSASTASTTSRRRRASASDETKTTTTTKRRKITLTPPGAGRGGRGRGGRGGGGAGRGRGGGRKSASAVVTNELLL